MDTYGALSIPVAVPTDPEAEATGDPALDVWAAYFKAYINAHGGVAWAAAFPRKTGTQAAPGDQIPPVASTFTHQPTDETILPFNERELPALFIYRAAGPGPKWKAIDWRVDESTPTILWVFPTGAQAASRIRVPYCNALVKLIDAAIEAYRDPSYVHASDTDPTAATLAALPEAIKTSIATSTSAQSYSGVVLDGIIGAGTISPPRAFIVTCDGPASAFVDGSTVSVTGLDVVGQTVTRTVTITTAMLPGPFATDHAFIEITQVDTDAQADTTGTFKFGVGAYQGRGSVVLDFAPMGLEMIAWKAQPIAIPMADSARPRYYDAVEITLRVFEKWDRDLESFDLLDGNEQTVSANEGAFIQQGILLGP